MGIFSDDISSYSELYLMDISKIRVTRLRQLFEESNLERAEFADKIGISYVQYGHYAGINPTKNIGDIVARRIEEKLNLPHGYMDSLENAVVANSSQKMDLRDFIVINNQGVVESPDPSEFVWVPRYDVKAACGAGYTNGDNPDIKHGLAFRMSYFQNLGLSMDIGKTGMMEAIGESMKYTINHGDVVLVDFSVAKEKPLNEKIYAIEVEGELRFKRVIWETNGVLRLVSDNSDKSRYPDEIIQDGDYSSIHIIGRVRWGGGDK